MNNESIVLGGGCFWCFDALYRRVKGVIKVTSGYAGGSSLKPTYWTVHETGDHAEVVKVEFDKTIISLETVLDIFWAMHDPTTLNKQMYDEGPEYRSIILYNSQEQKEVVNNSVETTAKNIWNKAITTEIKQLEKFWPAEDVHQDYFNKNPEQGYCQIIINPKVVKLKKKFSNLLVQE